MPVELWIGQEFKTTHERRAFDQFRKDVEAKFGQSKQLHFILANYSLDGREIDLTVLKRDAIIVVELKECADPIETSENGDWLTIPGNKIIGTGDQNPYQQAKDYRIKWANFLKRNEGKFLARAKISTMDFMHTSAFVAISPALHSNTKNNIPAHLPWFRLVGLDKLSQAIGQQTSPSLNFSDQELRSLVTDILHLKKFDPNISSGMEAINTHWLEYCHTLLTTHRDWTAMPPAFYLSSEQMDIAPARVILDKEQSTEFKLQFIPNIEPTLKNFGPSLRKSVLSEIFESNSSETKDLLSLVDESDRPVMLLGQPGLGKSLALERLALKYVEHYLKGETEYIPVLIRLRQYHSQKHSLNHLIRIALQSKWATLSEPETTKILQTEKLLLLFDSLDEAPHDSDIVPELATFLQEYPHHRYVISSRLNVYRASHYQFTGCREVELQRLTLEEAAKLWRLFVNEPDFEVLPDTIQKILQTPLFLRLYANIAPPIRVEVKTEAQILDLIVKRLPQPLKISSENREVVERCLLKLALEEKYLIDRQQVFDVVANYLEGESIRYQQKITSDLLNHPLLISTDDYVSFIHPLFKDYFAARGLENVIIKENSIESVLNYLGDPRWDDTIVYLAQILDEADLARLLEYLLDFNNPILALRCIRQRPSSPEYLIESVVRGLSEAIVTVTKEIPDDITPQEMSFFLLTEGGEGLTPEHLSQQNLTILLDCIGHLKQAVTDYELAPEIFVEPYLRPLLLSQEATHRMLGLYWLHYHLQASTPFSDNFIATISELFNLDFFVIIEGEENSGTALLLFRILIDLLPRIEHLAKRMEKQGDYLPGWEGLDACDFWESVLQFSEPDAFRIVTVALGLSKLKGERPLELLLSLVDHQEAQVRLVVALGLVNHRRGENLANMLDDPNPIVAHMVSLSLCPFPAMLSGRQFRLIIENLVSPLVEKISPEILEQQFVEFTILVKPLNYIVNPYIFQWYLNLLGHVLLEQGAMGFWYYIDGCKDKEDKIAAWMGGVIASVWVVGLVASGKVSLPASTAAPHVANEIREWIEQTEEFLLAWIKVTEEGRPYTDYYSELGGKFELSDDDIAYIKSWTDHDLTREIAEEVLTGRYRPRLKE